jgi:hypothetical protein
MKIERVHELLSKLVSRQDDKEPTTLRPLGVSTRSGIEGSGYPGKGRMWTIKNHHDRIEQIRKKDVTNDDEVPRV